MKRKAFISLLLLLIIVSGLFIFTLSTNDNPISDDLNTQQTAEKTQSNDPSDKRLSEEKKETDPDERNEEDSERTVKEMISVAIDRTRQFFSGQDVNIVAVGDSLTQGVGDSTNQGGYVGIIDRTINEDDQQTHIQNFGKKGDRTDLLLHRLKDSKVSASLSEADIILITVGANDIMEVVKENFTDLNYKTFVDERRDYEERLRMIFDYIQKLNGEADVYLIGFYNPFAEYFPDIDELEMIVDDWNRVGKEVTQDYPNTAYIPTKDLFTNETSELLADDKFHPNDQGYERMAERVLEYITKEDW